MIILVVIMARRKLMEIESRLLPCGLHVVGVMQTAEEAIATLVNIGELDRPDNKPEPIKGLPGILARAIGKNIEDVSEGQRATSVTPRAQHAIYTVVPSHSGQATVG